MSAQKTITIAASSTSIDNVGKASVFRVIETTAALEVRADNQSRMLLNTGQGFGGASGKNFKKLTLFNVTAAAITVTYYVGTEDYQDAQTTVNNVVVTTVKDSPTYTKATTQDIAAGGTVTFSGLDGAKVRKQFSVTNGCAVADDFELELQDGAATAGQWVYARQSWTNVTGGTVKVKNNGNGACRIAVLETFYV